MAASLAALTCAGQEMPSLRKKQGFREGSEAELFEKGS